MKRTTLRIAIGQINGTLANLSENLELIAQNVRQAKKEEADLLVFPELALTGYNVGSQFSDVAVHLQSPEVERLRELSRDLDLVVGFVEETKDAHFFNSSMYLSQGEILHVHRKVYPPNYGIFDERRYFGTGQTVSAFDTPLARMAMLICGDCWHISLPYLAAHDGANILLVMAASSDQGLAPTISCRDAWERLNQTYALTLSCFVVFVNRVGAEGSLNFWGGSHIIMPDGNKLTQASFCDPQVLVAELDLGLVRRQRIVLPFRRDDSLSHTLAVGHEILEKQKRNKFNTVQQPGLW